MHSRGKGSPWRQRVKELEEEEERVPLGNRREAKRKKRWEEKNRGKKNRGEERDVLGDQGGEERAREYEEKREEEKRGK